MLARKSKAGVFIAKMRSQTFHIMVIHDMKEMSVPFGFIVIRHVISPRTDIYWQESYDCIRHVYPDVPIIIVDDHSTHPVSNKAMTGTTIIESPFPPGRAELIPYLVYAQMNPPPFDVAVVLHDSVFVQQPLVINPADITDFRILWDFAHWHDQPEDEERLIRLLCHPDDLLAFHSDQDAWTGCFGVMSAIRHSFLQKIDKRYDLVRLVEGVSKRFHRMSLERVWACLLQKEGGRHPPLYGGVHDFFDWGVNIEDYQNLRNTFRHMPLVKVWTGR
jgi:hypothetical protein